MTKSGFSMDLIISPVSRHSTYSKVSRNTKTTKYLEMMTFPEIWSFPLFLAPLRIQFILSRNRNMTKSLGWSKNVTYMGPWMWKFFTLLLSWGGGKGFCENSLPSPPLIRVGVKDFVKILYPPPTYQGLGKGFGENPLPSPPLFRGGVKDFYGVG